MIVKTNMTGKKNPNRGWGVFPACKVASRCGSLAVLATKTGVIVHPLLVKHQPCFFSRRSFRAVGESCVINLIPDLKPDRSHPPPLSRSHSWHGAGLAQKGYRVHTLQGVERGGALPKEHHLQVFRFASGR